MGYYTPTAARNGMRRMLSLGLSAAMLLQTVAPAGLTALTGGPTQPEFATFQPVGTAGMVDPATGRFAYSLPVVSIPGPNGSGYSLALSYQSGTSPEEEASWVGYGWSLNAGAVTRVKRGFPDDYAGDSVRYWNRTKPNWTVTAGVGAGIEAYSVAGGINAKFRYNNYKGFSTTVGVDANVYGIAQLGLNAEPGGLSFSYGLNPVAAMSALGLDFTKQEDESFWASALRESCHAGLNTLGSRGMLYAQYTTSNDVRPTMFSAYDGWTAMTNIKLFNNPAHPCVDIGTYYGLEGSFSRQVPAHGGLDTRAAFGYMYSAKAAAPDMMDYYTEHDAPYSRRDRFLGVPVSNADYFTVSGQGVGGGFRLYNRKPGQFRPNAARSRMKIVNGGYEPHPGTNEVGMLVWMGVGQQQLDVGDWLDPNSAFNFADEAAADEPYFFRMNNDRGGAVSYGPDDDAAGAAITTESSIWGFEFHKPQVNTARVRAMNAGARSGRATYVGYTTVDEVMRGPAAGAGVYPSYQAYGTPSVAGLAEGATRGRIAEFAVTTPEGMRYEYGLAVYARKEKNLQYGLAALADRAERIGDMVYAHVTPPNAPVVVGEERDAPYAAAHLLTRITTPD